MKPRCDAPVPDEALLEYWADAVEGGDADRIEEHVFACEECAARLEHLASLGAALATLVRRGRIAGVISRSLVNRLQREGLKVRMYAAMPGERIPCAAFPGDELVILSMRANFAGAGTVSLSVVGPDGSVMDHVDDVPVSPADVEILWAKPGEDVRRLPSTHLQFTLTAGADGTVLAQYQLDHTALVD